MAHRYDPWKCVEFLCIVPKKFGTIYRGKQVSEIQILQTPHPQPKSNGKKTVINTMCENGTMSNHRSKYFKNLQPNIFIIIKKTGSIFSGTLLWLLPHRSLHD
jgi:hypothetical protein